MKKLRVAKYKRVSKKEQAIKGFSLQAQDEVLNEHIEKNGYILVGDYADEGISASTLNRPDLQRLLDDVRAGKIDLIIFTKLDRWFRSVAHYYKIQEILEEHGVPWRTVLEDYNTETSDGKFKVNIMLSVAQQELDRTSERIKVVFDSKVKNKQPITSALPYGYKIGLDENGSKRVVKDASAKDAIFDFFAFFEIHQSLRATMLFINNKYDLHLSYNTCKRMIRNSLYAGIYHGIPEYSEAYISEERFNKIQKLLSKNGNVKKYKYTYLFSGLIRCPQCKRIMTGCKAKSKKDDYEYHYYYYRCGHAYVNSSCKNRTSISETKIEEYLLHNVETELQKYIVESEVSASIQKKPKYDKAKLKRQLDRLNRQYREERIDDEEYDEEYNILQTKLAQCNLEPERRDLKPLRAFLESDFQMIYKSLSKEEQRSLWRSIISEIVVNDYDNINIKFI